MNDLRKVIIPLPSMDEQHEIAEKYKVAQDEVIISRLRLEKALNNLVHIFDEGNDNAK